MEDDRVSLLEQQLAQAKLIAEEADKKYEEVGHERANEKENINLFASSLRKPFWYSPWRTNNQLHVLLINIIPWITWITCLVILQHQMKRHVYCLLLAALLQLEIFYRNSWLEMFLQVPTLVSQPTTLLHFCFIYTCIEQYYVKLCYENVKINPLEEWYKITEGRFRFVKTERQLALAGMFPGILAGSWRAVLYPASPWGPSLAAKRERSDR